MKKLILGILIGASSICLFGFAVLNEFKKSYAEVNTEENLFLFVDSKPLMAYDVIGTEKTAMVSISDNSYPTAKDWLAERVKEKYPNAEGMIFTIKDGGHKYTVDVIVFKK